MKDTFLVNLKYTYIFHVKNKNEISNFDYYVKQ